MTNVKDSVSTVTGCLQALTGFGLSLIHTFVMIDVLFPGATGVVNNIGVIVGQFSKEGLISLIALLLFLLF